jgi:alginate O-acetyltransferase complex protein AlgI
MLFNSLEFLLFLPLVFALYWTTRSSNVKSQNILILLASYIFYGWWDWRFLILIAGSTVLDYFVGLNLHRSSSTGARKRWLWLSIGINIGLLGFFKYCNFFIESFASLLDSVGMQANYTSLDIILPVGISFYTFQTMSYTIDIYREKLKPTKDFTAFAAFISFFPQLVAGPIERASNLLPQFLQKRKFTFERAKDGLRQILWGFFKKIVIADGCAIMANEIFGTVDMPVDYATMPGGVLFAGSVYFAFQIYGDFSGYSDIAIGTAKLFGFDLMRNFNYPYFSRDIGEFWRRWHISLSTWFRDYLYIPLGGSRGGKWMSLRNVMIIFVVSGFWHGANWTFVVWGALNAIYFIPLLLANKNRNNLDDDISSRIFPPPKVILQIAFTFGLTCFAWIFFRAASLSDAFTFIEEIFTGSFLPSTFLYFHPLLLAQLLFFVVFEWIQRRHHHPLHIDKMPRVLRWGLYQVLIVVTLYSANYHEAQEFIYFQF